MRLKFISRINEHQIIRLKMILKKINIAMSPDYNVNYNT